MARTDRCRSLAELGALVDELAPGASTSVVTADRWVFGELSRAVRHDLLGKDCCRSLPDGLLSRANLAAYMTAAEQDDLRLRPRRTTVAHPENSTNVRRRVLRRFGKALGIELELPPPPRVRVIPPVTARQQARLQSHVSGWASFLPPQYARRAVYVRLAAIVGLVVDTGARSGELVAMTVDDLAADLSTATIIRRPQGGWPGEVEELPLSAATRKALAAWLDLRGQLVARLAGTPPSALWVSVRNGGRLGRAGLPIGPMALRRQYASAVAQLNADMKAQGVTGWVDLPRTLERLRHVDKTTRAPKAPEVEQPANSAATAA
jgi:integrase